MRLMLSLRRFVWKARRFMLQLESDFKCMLNFDYPSCWKVSVDEV